MKLGKNQEAVLEYVRRREPIVLLKRQCELLADSAGCSVEAVGRAVSSLSKKGLIRRIGGAWMASKVQDPEPSY